MLNTSSNNNSEISGERLYRKGVALITQKNCKIDEIKRVAKQDKSKIYTYTPKINKNSASISSKVDEL